MLMPKCQYEAMASVEEYSDTIERMNSVARSVPDIRKTDGQKRHPLMLHYFSSSCDWYVCEWDGKDEFFGYVILNDDLECSEWGYINRQELLNLETVLRRRGEVLNLDFYCELKTIEEALYERNPKYFARYKGE